LESWQIWLQYFCFSGATQLQAECAHFLVPAIPVRPYPRTAVFAKSGARLYLGTPNAGDLVSSNHTFPPRIGSVGGWCELDGNGEWLTLPILDPFLADAGDIENKWKTAGQVIVCVAIRLQQWIYLETIRVLSINRAITE
jgi:hypothetical protein